MALPPFPKLQASINTLNDLETGAPLVVLNVYEEETGRMVLPLTMKPAEARQVAHMLIEAAEAVMLDSNLIVSLRSRKMDETEISRIVSELREGRTNYPTTTQSLSGLE